ncbi:MAG: riboflavin synthase [Bacteroidia bacterium]
MFSGIIETLGKVIDLKNDQSNLNITVKSSITNELKIDQSIAHNGVCLTVVTLNDTSYSVTAIKETLQKTNLRLLKKGDEINLERCMILGARLDGHMVQGHVDQTAICTSVIDNKGSWAYTFEYDTTLQNITVEKGSICVNGVSLTVVNSQKNTFSVHIIPYTHQHTNFKNVQINTEVNLEFDILGKYISKLVLK